MHIFCDLKLFTLRELKLKFQFPQRKVGKTSIVKRSFQQQWFDRWSWLHYDEDQVDITNHFSIQIHIINYIVNSLTYTYVYCA